MAEFDLSPLLAESNIQASQPPADYQHNNYGVWTVLNRLDGGGRVAFMALGAETVNEISALYPTVPPKGLVVQERGFDVNLWGTREKVPTVFGNEHWSTPPEWLIAGKGPGWFDHQHCQYERLEEDHAVESMHWDWRGIHHLC
ncbi:MAG: hypothetical protein ABSH53_14695 [Holophaga sp.]|jgi:hypothetical protein